MLGCENAQSPPATGEFPSRWLNWISSFAAAAEWGELSRVEELAQGAQCCEQATSLLATGVSIRPSWGISAGHLETFP